MPQSTDQRITGIQTRPIDAPEHPAPSGARILHGRIIPPQQQILLFSSQEWEEFIEEWAQHQKTVYSTVTRFAGPNDMGIDVAAFLDENGFCGGWDNYQCKHYNAPITASTALPEIAKCIWHCYAGNYSPPRRYYFVAPKDVGITFKRVLLGKDRLKGHLIEKWTDWCATAINSTQKISLSGSFLDYVNDFDFQIFTFMTALSLIEGHRNTPYYSSRFGGGLPDRPDPEVPPLTPHMRESRYLQQLIEAYSDHKKVSIVDRSRLEAWPDIKEHYNRQREFFYHAESLKNFARDTVPDGTFEDLQDEIFAGVVDRSSEQFADALARLNACTRAASELALTANGLISVVKIQDRRGMCHQLANVNRLVWKR